MNECCHRVDDFGKLKIMAKDPIVAEVRSARQQLFEACNEDLNVLLDRFQEQEKLDQERLVSDTSPRIKQDCGTEPQRGAGSTRRGDDGM
jgi:hypothetical protein